MMYLWPTSISMVDMSPYFGVITMPKGGTPRGIREGRKWALDNGAFTGFNKEKFLKKLEDLKEYKDTCLFIVAPDVMQDPQKTFENFVKWKEILKDWPVAYVAQDGQENYKYPEFDWLFIGGSTKWKMGKGAIKCIEYAHSINKPVHVGRVNSKKRYEYFRKLACKSCDGTHPIYEPNTAKIRIAEWMESAYSSNVFNSNSIS